MSAIITGLFYFAEEWMQAGVKAELTDEENSPGTMRQTKKLRQLCLSFFVDL